MHGVPITLLYKNRSHYKTILGGYLSIFKILLILSYVFYSLVDVFNRKSTFRTLTMRQAADGSS